MGRHLYQNVQKVGIYKCSRDIIYTARDMINAMGNIQMQRGYVSAAGDILNTVRDI